MLAVRISTENHDEAYIVRWDDIRDANALVRYRDYVPIGKDALEVVSAADFCAELKNESHGDLPLLSVIEWKTADALALYSNPSRATEGFYKTWTPVTPIKVLLDMAATPEYPVPSQTTIMAVYTIRNRQYWFYKMDGHGADEQEYGLTILSIDREALEVLSEIPKLTASPSWEQANTAGNANVFMINGKLWIFPKSGGLLVIDQLTHISGDIAPFSD